MHKPKYFQDNKWTCGIKKSVLSTNTPTNDDAIFNDNPFAPNLLDDNESDECGDSSNIEKLRDGMREFIRKRLCKLPDEDITEGNNSDSEEEVWNAISTDDLQMDIEDVQEVPKKSRFKQYTLHVYYFIDNMVLSLHLYMAECEYDIGHSN